MLPWLINGDLDAKLVYNYHVYLKPITFCSIVACLIIYTMFLNFLIVIVLMVIFECKRLVTLADISAGGTQLCRHLFFYRIAKESSLTSMSMSYAWSSITLIKIQLGEIMICFPSRCIEITLNIPDFNEYSVLSTPQLKRNPASCQIAAKRD